MTKTLWRPMVYIDTVDSPVVLFWMDTLRIYDFSNIMYLRI